jgi:tetratricopeptide (TPR) repeat protein
MDDLGELLPELSGRERVEGLLGWIWATEWTELADETIAGAQEALELAQDIGDQELATVATARLSQGLAMRGREGDLDRAAELGQSSLDAWVPGSRYWDLVNQQHMFGEQLYWMGRLADAGDVMAAITETEADPQSLQARLRSASLRAMVLTSSGRYEEGLALFEQTLQLARNLGRSTMILQNSGRLAAARAEIDLVTGKKDDAAEWARKTIDLSIPVRRLKYEIVGRTLLGRTLVALGKVDEAIPELRLAVEQADRLGSPSQRWPAQAALGRALYASGDDMGAEQALAQAAGIIRAMAARLAPERATRFLGAEPVRDVLRGTTKPV